MLYIGLQIGRQGAGDATGTGPDQTDDRDQDTGQDIMLYTGRCTDQDADSRQQTEEQDQIQMAGP